MKQAVAHLIPFYRGRKGDSSQGQDLMATVKGRCARYRKNISSAWCWAVTATTVDMGVMVPHDKILKTALRMTTLSVWLALITPSWIEMVHVAKEMQRQALPAL